MFLSSSTIRQFAGVSTVGALRNGRKASSVLRKNVRLSTTAPTQQQSWEGPSTACNRYFRAYTDSSPLVFAFFEAYTSTWQYVVADPTTKAAAVIDPVLDYDSRTSTVSTPTADCLSDFIARNGLSISHILETHAHADHLTAARYLKNHLPSHAPIAIGERITQVQKTFAPKYGFTEMDLQDTFDDYLKDEQTFKIGDLSCRVMALPGHTPDHVGYLIGRSAFVGDSIFMPDVGSARADFPGGSAKALYSTFQKLFSLPDDYRLFVGHDYPSNRDPQCMTTVGEQRETNKHAKCGITEDEFIHMREARDATLSDPRLVYPALQVNIRAGKVLPSNNHFTTNSIEDFS